MLFAFLYILVFVLVGLILGSFMSVLITRIHDDKAGIVNGRSECPSCGHILGAKDLIPVVSFILNRGKCAYCGQAISYFYPALEVSMALLFLLASLIFPGWIAFFYSAVFFFFVGSFYFDLRYSLLPDAFSYALIALGLLGVLLGYSVEFLDAFYGLLTFGVIFGGQILISRGKWMGTGDLFLGLGLGLILGLYGSLLCIVLAYFLGSIIGIFILSINKDQGKKSKGMTALPFAPMMIFGAVISIFWGQQIIAWYFGMM